MKKPDPNTIPCEQCHTFKKEMTPILHKLLQAMEEGFAYHSSPTWQDCPNTKAKDRNYKNRKPQVDSCFYYKY
jgi:hypothetical protein